VKPPFPVVPAGPGDALQAALQVAWRDMEPLLHPINGLHEREGDPWLHEQLSGPLRVVLVVLTPEEGAEAIGAEFARQKRAGKPKNVITKNEIAEGVRPVAGALRVSPGEGRHWRVEEDSAPFKEGRVSRCGAGQLPRRRGWWGPVPSVTGWALGHSPIPRPRL